jgi:hypothetical protein
MALMEVLQAGATGCTGCTRESFISKIFKTRHKTGDGFPSSGSIH